jgi:hypothetical protein
MDTGRPTPAVQHNAGNDEGRRVVIDAAQAMRRLSLDPAEFVVTEVPHNRWLTPGIWQITSSDTRMIVKHLALERGAPASESEAQWTVGADRPRRWNYWARESLAYRSGLVNAYATAGITAPALLGDDHSETDALLLLEYADGEPAEHWDIAGYARAAAALGRAQGTLLVHGNAPEFSWLSRGFLREYSSEKHLDWRLLDDDAAWAQPLVHRNFPVGLREAAGTLHAARERLYGIAEALPRTLCHLDFWTKNLIAVANGDIVLFDWAFAGDGSIGEDVGNLVPDAAFDHFVQADLLAELHAAVLASYIDGLLAAGWTGDERLAELGMCAAAVKYDWLTPAMLSVASADRQMRYGGTEEIDPDERFRERGLALLHNAQVAARALELAETLGR